MNAGQTNLPVDSRVKLNGIKDKDFLFLNGEIGNITHPFAYGCTKKGWVGIILENGNKYNVKATECEIIE
jgi:hypothetical protein